MADSASRITRISNTIGGLKMSGNFVHCKRERQRIVYIYNILYIIYTILFTYYISKQYAAARACSAQNFPTFLGRLWQYIEI